MKFLKDDIKNIQNKLGNRVINFFEKENYPSLKGFSTGIYSLDEMLGTNGLVFSKIYEIFGPESSGKTTLALQIVKGFQDQNLICAYIDLEHSLDYNYAGDLGIKSDEMIISQPDNGENAFDIMEALINTQKVNLIVLDSVAALIPQAEIDAEFSDINIGLQARLMSRGLRKLNNTLTNSNTIIIFINQLRSNISKYFGGSEITPGGKALKFYSSVRLELRRIERITKNKTCIGSKIRLKLVKNKLNIPFLQRVVKLYFNKGIDCEEDIAENLIKKSFIIQKGPYFYIDNKKIALGKNELLDYIKKNKKMVNLLYKKK